MNKLLLITIAVSFMMTAHAEEVVKETSKTTTTTTETTQEPTVGQTVKKTVTETVEVTNQALTTSAGNRAQRDYGLFLMYSPIDLLIPGKIGGSFYFASDDKLNQYELAYLRASFSIDSTFGNTDVASITEQKLSFLNRNFSKGSNFNWYYGLSYASIDSHLGKGYVNSLPPGATHNPDLLQVDVLAIDFGIGNRWYFDNGLTLGVDWVGVSQPVATIKKDQTFTDQTTSQSDKDDVEKFMNIMTSFPRLYTMKLQLGYTF